MRHPTQPPTPLRRGRDRFGVLAISDFIGGQYRIGMKRTLCVCVHSPPRFILAVLPV
jgi:hypothetical protein